MELFIKQKVFSIGDKFKVFDINGNVAYYAQGELFSWGKKFHVMNGSDVEVAYIHQKVFSFLPRYYINKQGEDIAEVVKQFHFFRQEYHISGLNWTVEGSFGAHDYHIMREGVVIATIYKKWLSWGDTYEIDIVSPDDAVNVICVVLIIDAVMASESNSSD